MFYTYDTSWNSALQNANACHCQFSPSTVQTKPWLSRGTLNSFITWLHFPQCIEHGCSSYHVSTCAVLVDGAGLSWRHTWISWRASFPKSTLKSSIISPVSGSGWFIKMSWVVGSQSLHTRSMASTSLASHKRRPVKANETVGQR